MNREDQFETRLRHQPLRPVPPAWREEILSTARAAALPRESPPVARPSLFSTFNSLLSALLWPHPKAWASLAAVWLLILGLNLATREPSRQEFARQAAPPSPQMREMLKQQEQLLAELIGPVETPQATQPKPIVPQPRSQRRDEFSYT